MKYVKFILRVCRLCTRYEGDGREVVKVAIKRKDHIREAYIYAIPFLGGGVMVIGHITYNLRTGVFDVSEMNVDVCELDDVVKAAKKRQTPKEKGKVLLLQRENEDQIGLESLETDIPGRILN